MVELEKAGIPTVSYTAETFVEDAHRSADNYGIPDINLAVVPKPFSNRSSQDIHEMVDDSLEQVIEGIAGKQASTRPEEASFATIDDEWLSFEGPGELAALEAMNRAFNEYGWSDGLPLLPPTRDRVERMMTGTDRPADDVVAVLEPGFGMATVDKIAANAVMAGCEPDQLPVVIAALECLAEGRMHLRNKAMSTGPHAPMVFVNGPVAERIGMNGGICAVGPGAVSRVNSSIGRAIRLCMLNLCHAYPGVSDMDTQGSPAKYGLCFPENERESPWAPFHVDAGFASETSTVTVQFVYGMSDLYDPYSSTPERLIEVFATTAVNVASLNTGLWLIGHRADPRDGSTEREFNWMVMGPDQAAIFARAGWSKADIAEAMHREARCRFGTLILTRNPTAFATENPNLAWLWDSPESMLPVLESADCYKIAVTGGTAARGMFLWGAGESVTKPVETKD